MTSEDLSAQVVRVYLTRNDADINRNAWSCNLEACQAFFVELNIPS